MDKKPTLPAPIDAEFSDIPADELERRHHASVKIIDDAIADGRFKISVLSENETAVDIHGTDRSQFQAIHGVSRGPASQPKTVTLSLQCEVTEAQLRSIADHLKSWRPCPNYPEGWAGDE